ncbi:MAG: hypothetical protein HY694_14645 [Deltaproteobacteria bacterium]|nr:hypothetical protein [Deltaproteobacteria bacterium]
MKRVWSLLGLVSLLILSAQPVWARTCPKLIKEGKDLLASAKLSKANEDKVKALLDESQKLHDGGSHGDSVKKANEALDLLKKK